MSKNIYWQAKELLDKNHDYKLSEKERQLINTALIPLMTAEVFPKDITLREGLEELASSWRRQAVAVSRGRAVAARLVHNQKVGGSNPPPATRINSR